jgi:hypothetical protein
MSLLESKTKEEIERKLLPEYLDQNFEIVDISIGWKHDHEREILQEMYSTFRMCQDFSSHPAPPSEAVKETEFHQKIQSLKNQSLKILQE